MRIKVFLSGIIFAFALGIVSAGAPQEPISCQQLLAWVVGGMSTFHLQAQVEARGLAFQPDKSYLDLVKSAGGSPELLSVLPHMVKVAGQAAPSLGGGPAYDKLAAGAKALGAKDVETAGQSVAAAVQLNPNDPDLVYALGGVFQSAEDWEHAARAYHQATHLAPGFLDAHLALSYACYRLQDADCSEAEARLVLQRQPQDAEAHKDLGLASSINGDVKGAEAEYHEAIRLKPDYSNAYYDLGIVLHDLQEFDASIAAYQQAIKFDPNNAGQYYNLGISFADKGDAASAITAYRQAKKLDPTRLDIRQNLGAELCETGQYDETIKEFHEVLAIDPDWNMARGCLGSALYNSGHKEEGLAIYQEALRRDPTDEESRLGLGLAYMDMKKYSEAEAEFQKAERNGPDSKYPHWNLGRLYYQQGKFEPSSREVEAAVRLDPNNTRYLRQLAWDYEGMERHDKAQIVLEKMIALMKPTLGEASSQVAYTQAELALQLQMQGKYDEAKPLYIHALNSLRQDPNPNSNDVQTVINNYQQMLGDERAHQPAGSHVGPDPTPPEARNDVQATGAVVAYGVVPGQPGILTSMRNDLGDAQKALQEGRNQDAERSYQQALQEGEKLAPLTVYLVTALEQFAQFYDRTGRSGDADPLLERALEVTEHTAGPKSPEAADVLRELSMHYMFHKNLKAAEKYAMRNFAIRDQSPDMADFHFMEVLDILANVYTLEKDYAKAEPLRRRALSITEQTRGPEDAGVARCLDSLGYVYFLSGQFVKSEETYRRALGMVEKQYGPNSPNLLGDLYVLSEVLRNEGKAVEANELEKRREVINAKQQESMKNH